MTTLAVALLVAAVGLALLAVCVELADREWDRRTRLRAERRHRSERLVWERLDWVTDPAPANPEPAEAPVQPPAIVSAESRADAATRAAVARASLETPDAGVIDESPRRRLWRDTSALLFVGGLGILVYGVLATPGRAPAGGVLGATSSPAASPRLATQASPVAAPTATPAPSTAASPRLRSGSSPAPTPTRAP